MRTVSDFHSLIRMFFTDPAIRENFFKVSASPLMDTLAAPAAAADFNLGLIDVCWCLFYALC